MTRSAIVARDFVLGNSVELISGGPPMTIIEITLPGYNKDIHDTADIVAWWRAEDGSPQIIELDSRCVRPARRRRSARSRIA